MIQKLYKKRAKIKNKSVRAIKTSEEEIHDTLSAQYSYNLELLKYVILKSIKIQKLIELTNEQGQIKRPNL